MNWKQSVLLFGLPLLIASGLGNILAQIALLAMSLFVLFMSFSVNSVDDQFDKWKLLPTWLKVVFGFLMVVTPMTLAAITYVIPNHIWQTALLSLIWWGTLFGVLYVITGEDNPEDTPKGLQRLNPKNVALKEEKHWSGAITLSLIAPFLLTNMIGFALAESVAQKHYT